MLANLAVQLVNSAFPVPWVSRQQGQRRRSRQCRQQIQSKREAQRVRSYQRLQGWLGYDDQGHIEGTFTEAPEMFIDRVEDDVDDEDVSSEAVKPPKEWEPMKREAKPRPSAQFLRAMVGRPFLEDF